MHASLTSPAAPDGARLRHLAPALARPRIELLAAPKGLEVPLTSVVFAEPEDPPQERNGQLVLIVGARGRRAMPMLVGAARAGASAVAVKTGTDEEAVEALRDAASEWGIALFGVGDAARWEEVEAVTRAVLDTVPLVPDVAGPHSQDDLTSLVQTLATLTSGIVSVEDGANRVLAHSRTPHRLDHVDEVRRRSILGQACPEEYLAVLREAGVYTRLRAGQEVLEIAARPELGARRRFVAGITAGKRLLGTIWVQEGPEPLAEQAEQVLCGAARLAALMLLRGPGRTGQEARLREEMAARLLEGALGAGSLAGHLGIAVESGVSVIAVGLGAGGTEDGPSRELAWTRTAEIVSVHAAAYRRTAVTTQLDGRLYVLMPETGRGEDGHASDQALTPWTNDLVATLRGHLSMPVQAAVAAPVVRLADAPQARESADRVLGVIAGDPSRAVATYTDVRAEVVLGQVLELLDRHPEVHDPALDRLTDYDAKHGGELASSLLMYLDTGGEVASVAGRLHIHPNTLRHRVRRAVAISGIDLDSPEQRLVAMLQLRKSRRPHGR